MNPIFRCFESDIWTRVSICYKNLDGRVSLSLSNMSRQADCMADTFNTVNPANIVWGYRSETFAGFAHETYQSAAFRVMSSSQKFQMSTITQPLKNRELDQGQVVHWRTPLYIRPTCNLQFDPSRCECHYWHQGLENQSHTSRGAYIKLELPCPDPSRLEYKFLCSHLFPFGFSITKNGGSMNASQMLCHQPRLRPALSNVYDLHIFPENGR